MLLKKKIDLEKSSKEKGTNTHSQKIADLTIFELFQNLSHHIAMDSKEIQECPICFEVLGEKNRCITECGHSFCTKCLLKAFEDNSSCPCCRTMLVEEEWEDVEDDEEEDDEEEDEETDEEEEDDERASPIEAIAFELEKKGYSYLELVAMIIGRGSLTDETKNYKNVLKQIDEISELVEKMDDESYQRYEERENMKEEDVDAGRVNEMTGCAI